MLSIAPTLLAGSDDARVTLLYGNRTTGTVMFAEELADLKNSYGPRLELVHVLSREPRDVELFSGRLDADRLRRLLTALVPVHSVDHVWLCGPFGLIADAREVLEDLEVRRTRCTSSCSTSTSRRRRSSAGRPSSKATRARSPSSSTAARPPRPCPGTAAILDGAAATRNDLPFACKGGVCGTCRAHVDKRRGGHAPQLRARATDEVERGFVLTCQTHPVDDAVTVDFDA